MAIENNFKSFKQETYRFTKNTQSKGTKIVYSYDEAFRFVTDSDEFKEKISSQIDDKLSDKKNSKVEVKDKEYFRHLKKEYNMLVTEIVAKNNLTVREYSDITRLVKDFVEDMVGYSAIKDLMYDERVTDIYCLAFDKIYYESTEHKTPVKFNGGFKSEKAYSDFIERLLREAGKSNLDSGENKVIDFDLYGDRYNALSQSISPNGKVITIRKHKEDHIKLQDIIKYKCMSPDLAKFLGKLILGECNMIIAGITGSGKTTTMRALLDYFVASANKRMLVCEDTRELFPTNDHTLELVTSPGVDKKTTIDLADVIILALRQKPKYIVVGEVRGKESESAVEAMATGHSTIFSMHSGTPIDAINRLVTKYLMQMPSLGVDVVERIIGSAVDYIAIQDDIPGIGRRITSVTEVTYNYEERRVNLKTIWRYNFHKQDFERVNDISLEKAEKMLRKGIKIDELKEYVAEWRK